ncbi:MAG: hypothetical protein L6R48_24595 [Planctomycetes bacterium]|nr:hypothetical protein [Planctomycetota bacterium]
MIPTIAAMSWAWLLPLLLVAPLAAADPAIAPLPDQALAEDFPLRVVNLTGLGGDGPLTVSARSSAPAVLPDPYVVYTSPATTGQLLLAAASDANGSALVTVTVSDSGGRQAIATFAVTVAAVNDAPRFAVPAAVAVDEDTDGTIVITGLEPGPASEAGQVLRVQAAPIDANIRVWGVDYTPGSTTATVRIHGSYNFFGSTGVVVTVLDDGGTNGGGIEANSRLVPVEIAPVNDFPILMINELLTGSGGTVFLKQGVAYVFDADDDPIVFTLTTAPAHGALYRFGIRLTAGATFTMQDIHDFNIRYLHDGTATAGDAFSLIYTDGAFVLGPVSWTVEIAGRARPALALYPGTTSWREGDAATAVAPEAELFDNDSPDYAGGFLIVSISDGLRPGDQLTIADTGLGAGQFQVTAAGLLTWESHPIGTAVGGTGGAPLVASFTSALATPAVVQALVRALRFANATRNPGGGTRSIEVVVNDGDTGPSLPTTIQVLVTTVDDPPVAPAQTIALAAGIARRVILAASDDQDVPTLRWTLGALPAGLSAVLLDAVAGRLELRAAPGVNGRLTLPATVSDGVNPPVAVAIAVVVTAATAPRPHPAGELPGQAFRGERLTVAIPWDCRLVPGAVLDFTLVGDPPPGLTVEAADATTATLLWTVPDDEPLSHRSFTLLAIDRASNACGALPALLPIRERPRGSN